MSDFVNGFWGYFISIVAVGGVVWCVWLLYTQRRWLSTKPANGQVEDTGHVWDGDLTELNNPVPGWWTWMYLLACVFALGYLFFMPGWVNTRASWATAAPTKWRASRPRWPKRCAPSTRVSRP